MKAVNAVLVHQVLLASSLVWAKPATLTPRKATSPASYDPFIVCDFDGPEHTDGLPLGFSELVYSELYSLCSAAKGAMQNVGCFCTSAHSQVQCDQNLADAELWSAQYAPQDSQLMNWALEHGAGMATMSFQDLCKNACDCRGERDADNWYRRAFQGESISGRYRMDGRELDFPSQGSAASSDSSASNSPELFQAWGDVTYHKIASDVDPSPAPPTTNNGKIDTPTHHRKVDTATPQHHRKRPTTPGQCGQTCTKMADCSPLPEGTKGTCACQAHASSQYQPGAGTVAFIASCLISVSGIGKRDDSVACPCNSTYVSNSCCQAPQGLVWEAPEFKLGALLPST